MRKERLKYWPPAFSVLLLLSIVGQQLPASWSAETAAYPDKDRGGPFSCHPSNLIAVGPQSEEVECISGEVPDPRESDERETYLSRHAPAEAFMRWRVSVRTWASRLIEPGLPVYLLIFPFHYYL